MAIMDKLLETGRHNGSFFHVNYMGAIRPCKVKKQKIPNSEKTVKLRFQKVC